MVNIDPRYIEAGLILDAIIPGVPTKLYKTTRAGATTGLCANTVDNDQTFCLIAPTKKIAHETITTTEKYANQKNLNICTLIANHDCIIIQKMIEQYPDLGHLPIIPLPWKCEYCEYRHECPITEFLRTDRTSLNGLGLTFDKLTAIILSGSKLSKDILTKMIETMDVIIFDEADYYEGSKDVSVRIYPRYDINRLISKTSGNKIIQTYLTEYKRVLDEASKLIDPLLQNKNDYAKRRMSLPLQHSFDVGITTKGMNAVVSIMKHRADYDLSIHDVQYLSNIIMLMSAGHLVVHYIKINDEDTIQLSGKNGLYSSTQAFLKKLTDKKVIFTSATFGDYDYSPIFGQHDELVMKDTMNSNAKMIIYPDTYMLDSILIKKRKRMDVLSAVEKYSMQYPDAKIVCMKKEIPYWLKKSLEDRACDLNTDYYKSDTTLGVANDGRRCVLVGPPISPINAFDGVTQSYAESQKRRVNSNHAALWQAISRFKDPAGIATSHVHCIGITEKELKLALTWGKGRHLKMSGIRCKDVTTTKQFSEVTIIPKNEMKVWNMLQQPNATYTSVMAQSTQSMTEGKIAKSFLNLRNLGVL